MPSSSNRKSVNQLTKVELQAEIQAYGETPPAAWTKIQLVARLSELREADQNQARVTEKDVVRAINQKKTKAELRQMMEDNQLQWGRNATIADLKKILFEHGMKEVLATDQDHMGFGKHSHLTFREVLLDMPSYTKWCIETMEEGPECHWRLRRFATWANNVTESEKERLRQAHMGGEFKVKPKAKSLQPPRRLHVPSQGTASQVSSQMTDGQSWEIAEDESENITPEQAIQNLEMQIRDLRRQLQQPREMSNE